MAKQPFPRLRLLREILSAEEFSSVTERAVGRLDEAAFEEAIRGLPPDTARAAREALFAGAAPEPGAARVEELWRDGWEVWRHAILDSFIHDSGPWLDADEEEPGEEERASDDPVWSAAAELLALLPRVRKHGIRRPDPLEEIRSLFRESDFGPLFTPDGVTLDQATTAVLIEWLRTGPDGKDVAAFRVIDRIRKLDDLPISVEPDPETMHAFVRSLPGEDERRRVFDSFRTARSKAWKDAIADPDRVWATIYLDLARVCDPAAHEALALERAFEDPILAWREADALRSLGHPEKAIPLYLAGLACADGREKDEGWSIFEDVIGFDEQSRLISSVLVPRLLQDLAAAARDAGRPDIEWAAGVQAAVIGARADPTRVLAALREAPADLPAPEALVGACVGHFEAVALGGRDAGAHRGWIGIAIACGAMAKGGGEAFRDRIREHARAVAEKAADFAANRRSLAVLTLEAAGPTLRAERPELAAALAALAGRNAGAPKWRAALLAHLGADELAGWLIEFWGGRPAADLAATGGPKRGRRKRK